MHLCVFSLEPKAIFNEPRPFVMSLIVDPAANIYINQIGMVNSRCIYKFGKKFIVGIKDKSLVKNLL